MNRRRAPVAEWQTRVVHHLSYSLGTPIGTGTESSSLSWGRRSLGGGVTAHSGLWGHRTPFDSGLLIQCAILTAGAGDHFSPESGENQATAGDQE